MSKTRDVGYLDTSMIAIQNAGSTLSDREAREFYYSVFLEAARHLSSAGKRAVYDHAKKFSPHVAEMLPPQRAYEASRIKDRRYKG